MEIKMTNVTHTYMPNTPFEHKALSSINLHISQGQFVAIIGHTGSGKSTIIQHLNGLLKPTTGSVQIGDIHISANKKNKELKRLRKIVGMVFQYPEHQLFDETVEKDIAFGPINFGASKEEALNQVSRVLPLVGLDESIRQKSPFELSGGQKRRVAIAGVLANKPQILVLDEPTAGLDPMGREEMMKLFTRLHREQSLTTILVTHNMEFAAMYADLIVVMDRGSILMQGTAEEVFQYPADLKKIGLNVPDTVQLALMLKERFQTAMPTNLFTEEELVNRITTLLDKGTK